MDVYIPRCHYWTPIVLLPLFLLNVSSTETPCTNCDGTNVTCVDGVCQPRCVNVTSSGECLQCLDSRFYGEQCEHDCPDTCLNSRCKMDSTRVVCTEGCVAGKKGENCGSECPTACKQCERYGDGCTGPCQNPQYYGQRCNTPCPANCRGGCNRITGDCVSCEPGYKGTRCDVTCPLNCRGGCDKDSGECINCVLGYRGRYCDICEENKNPCRVKRCGTCDGTNVTCVDGVCLPRCVTVTSSGACLQCRDSRFYGEQCEHDCPDNCFNSRCQMDNNRVVCTEGCVAGKKGDNCGVNCPTACRQCERYGDGCTGPCQNAQYYGQHCRTPCPSNCRGGCNRITGECDSCEPGYTRDKCDATCPPNCRGRCDKDTGECASCEPGYTGKYCNATCPPNCIDECDKDTGVCTHSGPALIWIGSVMLAVVVAASFLFLLVFLWKRRKGRRLNQSQDKQMTCEMTSLNNNDLKPYDFQQNPSSSLELNTCSCQDDDLQRVIFCEDLIGDGSSVQIIVEFQRLCCPDIEKAKYGSLDDNASKNRYRDVLPYDSSRVSLETDDKGENDYINASFIDGYKAQIQYVAAQGPSVEVVVDFWRMIWQLNITKIVMLTNLVEAGKVKCEMYWPFCSSDFSTYGKVYVQCVEEKVYENYTLRKLAVWKEHSDHRLIRQFHFTSWPDHGVPGETTSILDFHRVVKDTKINSSGPLLIHCSAGIGRTGTFIALDYLLDQARKEGRVCIYTCVQNLRQQRMKMVQTKEQYAFIYKVLTSALESRGSSERYREPVVVLCWDCWRRRKGNCRSNASLEKNDPEYQNLRNSLLLHRISYLPNRPSPPQDEYAIMSETTPPRLHRSLKACSIDGDMDTWMDTSV